MGSSLIMRKSSRYQAEQQYMFSSFGEVLYPHTHRTLPQAKSFPFPVRCFAAAAIANALGGKYGGEFRKKIYRRYLKNR